MILGVLLEVLGQLVNPFGEQSYLNFSRAGVLVVAFMFPDKLLFSGRAQWHNYDTSIK
jgi:hypothetical protein